MSVAENEIVQYVTIAADDFVELENLAVDARILKPLFKRLQELVQNNQAFFGDPPAGVHAAVIAVNKLEDLVEFYNYKHEMDTERPKA